MKRRVVITGLGPISAVGLGKDKFWDSVIDGRSNYTEISRFDVSDYPTKIAAQVCDFDPEDYVHTKTLRRIRQFEVENGGLSLMFAVAAANLAVRDSQLELDTEDKTRVGTMVGDATGDLALIRGIKRPNFQITQYSAASSPNACIAFQYDLRGPTYIVSGACATANLNLVCGLEKIVSDRVDIMFVGSTSALILSPHLYADYSARGSPMTDDNQPMRPFDRNRRGFILGEGAGVLILEELEHALARGAHIYAEVLGYGEATDVSTHFADVTKEGYVDCMSNAIQDVGLTPEMLERKKVYLNAHGTATKKNDEVEMAAVRDVFGKHTGQIYISSIKGTTGHAQEAASGMELIASALALDQGIIPPSTNIRELDPSFKGLRIVKDEALKQSVDVVLKNAAGFCGVYSTVALGRYSD
jgi:3-oxoacyl-[acyl-carrier-protein] synthase II